MPQKINLVTVVLDGSYLLEEHFETIFEAYLEPILKHIKQQQILIEKEDKEKKGETEKNRITPKLKCGLVIFGNYEPISRSPVTIYYFEENLSQFEKLIAGIEFEDGGMRENAVAEGLVAALEMFDAYKSQMKPEISETEIIRHCLLISNSHPCPDLVHRNIDEKYDQYSMKQIVEEMKNQKIHLSLITPERNFTELEELVTEVNKDIEVHDAKDVINPSHVVKLAGFKPLFTHPKEAQKRKREDSTSSTSTNDQQIPPAQGPGNEAKKVKLEPTQEPVKDQPPIPNGQLPGQQSQSLQSLSLIEKNQTTATQNPSGQQQPTSNQPTVVNSTTSSAQSTPKLQTPPISSAKTSNTTPHVIQNSPNVLAQTQQPVKITNQAAPNNVQMQLSAPTSSTATVSRPLQRPPFIPQPRPQQNISGIRASQVPSLHNQLQAQLSAMTPELRKQFIALRSNPHIRNLNVNASAFANANAHAQQLLRQNTLLQQELAASQQNLANVLVRSHNQLNIGQTMLHGTQMNIGQQFGNLMTSSEAVSTQALNGFAAATAQQLGAFNTSVAPISNPASDVGYTTASTAQLATSVNNAQLPVSTMISADGQAVTTGVNGQIRSNLPQQKKINALWNGHIAWNINNMGQKRELNCQVTAFPTPTKKAAAPNAPTAQIDYMTQYWPDKMEISGINLTKEAISSASTNPNPKIVSFLPNPALTTPENNATFGHLFRSLEGKKMAAFIRFPKAPNQNGGMVLFTNGVSNPPKLFGLLFLDTPLPMNTPFIPQARPPQAVSQQSQQQNLQQLQLQMALRNQQQQQQQQQQPMQMQASALQQQQQQQQKLAALQTQLLLQQQHRMTNIPPNIQQMIQQQRVMQPTMLQNSQADVQRHVQQLLTLARNNNPDITQEQLVNLLRQRQQSQQQPTQ